VDLVGDVAGRADDVVASVGQRVGGGLECVVLDVRQDDAAPAAAKAWAVASSMPELAPVTSATELVKS
jgi:hypothetical protein